jgi:hypothetical protein
MSLTVLQQIVFHDLKSNHDLTFNGGCFFWTGSKKILTELIGVDFIEKEETMDETTTNRIIKTLIIGGLAPYQMFEFYPTFGLRDPSIWGIFHTRCSPNVGIFTRKKERHY